VSAGARGGITGKGAHLAICDDPIKDAVEAHSQAIRDQIWDWWTTTFLSRLEPTQEGLDPIVVLIMCMTGDTPVLMADGGERPLRDIRPGDRVATYESGGVAEATVRNWASQGRDSVFEITTRSGSVVRANARHPFLVAREGGAEWRRTDALREGDEILRVTGGNGEASRAPQMDAPSLRGAGASVPRTTARADGRTGIGRHLPILVAAARRAFSIATESARRATRVFWPSRVAVAPCAASGPVGQGICASIIDIATASSAAYSATTATSCSATAKHLKSLTQQRPTYAVTPDPIVRITPAGTDEVFDLQIDRTENFIANGLVSHNTRWHEDDLAGRIMALPDFAETWEHIHLPAVAEHDDVLGRRPGEPLWPARFDGLFLEAKRHEVGQRPWQAMWQGNPQPPGGISIDKSWWRYYDTPPKPEDFDQLVLSVDPTFKGNSDSDYVAMGVVGRIGASFYLMDVTRKQMNGPDTLKAIVGPTGYDSRWGDKIWLLIEDTASGSMICDILERDRGRVIRGKHKSRQKEVRLSWQVNGAAALIERGAVYIQENSKESKILVDEGAAFPHGKNDDLLDMLVQGLEHVLPRAWTHEDREARAARQRPPKDYVEQMSQQLHAAVKKRIAMTQRDARRQRKIQFPGL